MVIKFNIRHVTQTIAILSRGKIIVDNLLSFSATLNHIELMTDIVIQITLYHKNLLYKKFHT